MSSELSDFAFVRIERHRGWLSIHPRPYSLAVTVADANERAGRRIRIHNARCAEDIIFTTRRQQPSNNHPFHTSSFPP